MLLAVVAWCSATGSSALADATINVTPTGCQLPDAIQAAETGNPTGACPSGDPHGLTTIVLAGGHTYSGVGLHITSGRISLVGHKASDTTVSGEVTGRILQIDKGATVTIENLTLSDGVAPNGTSGGSGGAGGAVLNNGTLNVLSSVFSFDFSGVGDNAGAGTVTFGGGGGPGGAIANYGSLAISGSTFVQDATNDGGSGGSGSAQVFGGAGGPGGAVASFGSLAISRSSFSNNYTGNGGTGGGSSGICMGGAGGSGAAVAVLDGTARIVSSSFSSNQTGNGGLAATGSCSIGNGGNPGDGAVFNGAPSTVGHGTTVSSSTIVGNVTGGGGGTGGNFGIQGQAYGGGVSNGYGGVLVLRAATIEGNKAEGGSYNYGGGLTNSGVLTLRADTLDRNSTVGPGSGGGLYSQADPKYAVQIVDSTIAGNTAADGTGAGVELEIGTVGVTASTIARNFRTGVPTDGSGIDIADKTDKVIERDSVVASNGAANCTNHGGTLASLGHNLSFPDKSCAHEVIGAPKLGLLAANGGPTKTFALEPGSAAIDKVPASDAGCAGTTDQRGVLRPQGPRCDIGALEVRVPVPNTEITKVKVRSAKHRAAFRFEAIGYASGFQCALIKPRHSKGKQPKKRKPHFTTCKSPKTYKHLKLGKYSFLVRAFTNDGADRSPAKTKFTLG